jgi:hypothetical protein
LYSIYFKTRGNSCCHKGVKVNLLINKFISTLHQKLIDDGDDKLVGAAAKISQISDALLFFRRLEKG